MRYFLGVCGGGVWEHNQNISYVYYTMNMMNDKRWQVPTVFTKPANYVDNDVYGEEEFCDDRYRWQTQPQLKFREQVGYTAEMRRV